MSSQLSKDAVFLTMASQLGQLGTCDRAKVGAIIVLDGRAVSWGYNGAPPGLVHCNRTNHGYGEPHGAYNETWLADQLAEHGCQWATHAEANAIAFAARQGISTRLATMYCEYAACSTCARLMIAAGISRSVYAKPGRDRGGIPLLHRAKIEVVQYDR